MDIVNYLVGGLLGCPPLLKLSLVLALMLVLVRVKLNVGWALCLGAAVCAYWFGQSTAGLLASVWAAMQEPRYVTLVAIIMLVLVLNHSLQKSGQIARIVDTFRGVSRRPRTTLVFFPALLGLLPMPGGAQFSAPMVGAAGEPLGLSSQQKTLINYWFRHIWEYCWILYPGIILTSQLAGYPIWVIALLQFPMLVAVFIIGYFFFLRPLDLKHRQEAVAPAERPAGHPLVVFLKAAAPVWLVILIYVVMRGLYALATGLDLVPESFTSTQFAQKNLDNAMLVTGICLAILYTWRVNRMSLGAIRQVVWQRDMYNNLLIGLGIIVFAGVLAGSGAAGLVAQDLKGAHIAIWLVAMILPFTVGAVTGITMNMVLLTYPIILSALQASGQDHLAIAYCCLAFASGYAGILITPLHICMLQSNQYFNLGPTAILRPLAVPVLLTILSGLLLFLFYSFAFPHLGWGPGTHLIPTISGAH